MKRYEINRKKLESLLWNIPNVELILNRDSHDFDVIFYNGTYDVEWAKIYGNPTIMDVRVSLDANLNVTGIDVSYDILSCSYAITSLKTLLDMKEHQYLTEDVLDALPFLT